MCGKAFVAGKPRGRKSAELKLSQVKKRHPSRKLFFRPANLSDVDMGIPIEVLVLL